jgi:CBS domain-containing protein
MVTTQAETESQVIELSEEALEAFCDDISGMFDVDMECSRQDVCTETVKGLKKRFKKLTAVNSVGAEGALNGTFHLIFDQGGLFTLSGVVVMLPEKRILEEIKRGSIKDVERMSDAAGEMGNMLVGSWDRVFRKELDGHGHFVQTNTFIGEPWDEPEQTIGLADDEEFVFLSYEMTIGSYPPFKCGVIFPKTTLDGTSKSGADQAASTEQTDVEEETKQEVKEQTGEETVEKAEEKTEQEAKEEPEAATEKMTEEKDEEKVQEQKPKEAKAGDEGAEKTPLGSADVPSAVSAEDIMEKDVVWGSGDDSVQQALTKMQQADVGYMMIGTDGVPEGIVSKSDITGAISPYLRPVFAKWHRPLDDATLQIRVKWIMSRPVRTIKPQTPLMAVMENMRQFGLRALPVADEHSKVLGLVTVFSIFNTLLLNSESDTSTAGKTPQAPPLVKVQDGRDK